MHYRHRIIVLSILPRHFCLCVPEGVKCNVRIVFSCLSLLAGLAAAAISISENASAAAGSVCAMRSDGPKWYETAAAAKKDHARIMHPGDCETVLCIGAEPKVALAMGLVHEGAICGMDPLNARADDLPEQLRHRSRRRDLYPRRALQVGLRRLVEHFAIERRPCGRAARQCATALSRMRYCANISCGGA